MIEHEKEIVLVLSLIVISSVAILLFYNNEIIPNLNSASF
jgi:hypothetical protein